jgi:hypothetical protein
LIDDTTKLNQFKTLIKNIQESFFFNWNTYRNCIQFFIFTYCLHLIFLIFLLNIHFFLSFFLNFLLYITTCCHYRTD